jgi:hypothetical protein
MFQRYGGLLLKDIVTAFRNYFFLIVLGVALLFVGLTNFLIPKELSMKPAVYYFVDYDGEFESVMDKAMLESKEKHGKIQRVEAIEDIETHMRRNFNSLGMVIKEENNQPHVQFILQGHENEKLRNTLVLSMKDELRSRIQENIEIKRIFLNKDIDVEKTPFNLGMIPIFIVMESMLLGFFLIAALVFMEKDEGTIRAYLVSPGKVPEYLAAKITLMVLLGCISAITLVSLTLGTGVDYMEMLILVILGSIAAAIGGLILASFFQNISQASIWIIVIGIVLSLPFMSYYIPSFAPRFVKMIPTYALLFSAREILFPTGSREIIYRTFLGLLTFNVIGYMAAVAAYRLSVRKD